MHVTIAISDKRARISSLNAFREVKRSIILAQTRERLGPQIDFCEIETALARLALVAAP